MGGRTAGMSAVAPLKPRSGRRAQRHLDSMADPIEQCLGEAGIRSRAVRGFEMSFCTPKGISAPPAKADSAVDKLFKPEGGKSHAHNIDSRIRCRGKKNKTVNARVSACVDAS